MDGETAVFEKFISVTSTDHLKFPKFKAISESQKAYRDGWEKVLAEYTEAWNRLMTRNQMADYRDPITGKLPENDGVIEALQIEAVASRYYIMQNLFPDDGSGLNVDGASVGGLSSSAYGGMLFWDQDFWIHDPIAITNPNYARQILNARVKLYSQALSNAQADYVQEKYKFK